MRCKCDGVRKWCVWEEGNGVDSEWLAVSRVREREPLSRKSMPPCSAAEQL
jgi:hypothetical protein